MNMNNDKANHLITEYVNGWIDGDAERVLNTLAPDCLIVESHGPRFEGRDEVEKWINDWNKDGSKVIEWEIRNKFLQDTNAAFQWYFRCIVKGREYKIDGASFVEFRDERISIIFEYMQTKPEAKKNQ